MDQSLLDIQKKLTEFNVQKITVDKDILKLQIKINNQSDVRLYETLIKERFPEYQVQIVFLSMEEKVKKFKKIIGVTSGKGGVGKSVVSLNLAFTLRDMGYSVGVLDADIYTPSIPGLLMTNQVPISKDGSSIETIKTHGIEILSMGLFLKYNQTPLWNDNLIESSFRQFLLQGDWNCDYLIVDFAAGMSGLYDICLKLIPKIAMILIANGNKMIYRDVFRMYSFLKAMKFEVAGVIDNMSSASYKMEQYKEFNGQIILNLGYIPYFEYYLSFMDNGYPVDYTLTQDKQYFTDLVKKLI